MPIDSWLPEHVNALRDHIDNRAGSHAKIAVLLNLQFRTTFSRNAVIGKAHRLGLEFPPKAAEAQKPKRRRRMKIVVKAAAPKTERKTAFRQPPVAPQAPEPFNLRCVEIEPRAVSLLDLQPGECRWPDGDGPFTFCGHPAVFGSYCGAHHALSVGPGTSPGRSVIRTSWRHA